MEDPDPVPSDSAEDDDAADEDEADDEEDEDGDAEDEDEGEDEDPPPPDDDGVDDEPEPEPQPEAAVPCDDAVWGGYDCVTEGGEEGVNYCILLDGEEFYTDCSIEAPECEPGNNWDKGCVGEICYWDGGEFRNYYWEEPDCDTPLVLSFDGAPIEYAPAAAAAFDLSPTSAGGCMTTDWPSAPWLALDRDGNGFIEDGSELFGNATRMSTGGATFEHGFAALAELDSNRDGKITAADARFEELLIWNDLDGDRVGAYAELRPVSEMSLVSIDLGFHRRNECDSRGNCGFERASFEFETPQGTMGVGEVVDVHLACR